MSRKGNARRVKTAEELREDSRAETRLALGPSLAKYRGHTPHEIDGRPTFAARVGGFGARSRMGTTARRRDGGLTFVPDRGDVEPDAKPIATVMPMATIIGDAIVPVATLSSATRGYVHESLLARDMREVSP